MSNECGHIWPRPLTLRTKIDGNVQRHAPLWHSLIIIVSVTKVLELEISWFKCLQATRGICAKQMQHGLTSVERVPRPILQTIGWTKGLSSVCQNAQRFNFKFQNLSGTVTVNCHTQWNYSTSQVPFQPLPAPNSTVLSFTCSHLHVYHSTLFVCLRQLQLQGGHLGCRCHCVYSTHRTSAFHQVQCSLSVGHAVKLSVLVSSPLSVRLSVRLSVVCRQ